MRLWSLHPSFLDSKGLVALWREALLAQHVLHGKTKGYRHHPQLQRFEACTAPKEAIAAYLQAVHAEAVNRGYCFDGSKIMHKPARFKIKVSEGQVAFELTHLRAKLQQRDPAKGQEIKTLELRLHPLFTLIPGPIEPWERV